jgi:hypothetical protein
MFFKTLFFAFLSILVTFVGVYFIYIYKYYDISLGTYAIKVILHTYYNFILVFIAWSTVQYNVQYVQHTIHNKLVTKYCTTKYLLMLQLTQIVIKVIK